MVDRTSNYFERRVTSNRMHGLFSLSSVTIYRKRRSDISALVCQVFFITPVGLQLEIPIFKM